jgi:hypothetical protein
MTVTRTASAPTLRFILIGLCLLATFIVVVLSFAARITPIKIEAKTACLAIMKQIEGAKWAWAENHNKTTNNIPRWPDLVGPHGYLREIPQCPNGGAYAIGKMSEPPTCSIGKDNDYYRRCMGLAKASTTDQETSERSQTSTNAYERLIKPTNTN